MQRASMPVLLVLGGSAILSLAVPRTAWALTYNLSSDLGVHGLFHLCEYSNGKIYSFNATQLCPMQISDDAPISTGGNMTGFKVGEYRDGMTKVCVYNVMGKTQAIRIGALQFCPLSYNF